MLLELLEEGYGRDMDLNCAERVLYGANQAYQLGLDKDALKLAAAFGGGMGIEDKCGALTGSLMVLGKMFVKDRAHESDKVKVLSQELFERFETEMGSIDCKPLKDEHRSELTGCRQIIFKAAKILDQIIAEEK